MIDMLRDPFWQFIGVLLTLITIVLTIYIFLKERAKKSLIYEITSFFPFLTVNEEAKGDFQVLYKGNEVKDLFLITLQIINSGNMPITSKDYEKPISLLFGELSKVYSAEVVKTQPETLTCDLTIDSNKVSLSPILLNSGDSIDIKCLITLPEDAELEVDGRIVGVKDILEKRSNPARYMGWAIIGVILMIIAIIYSLFSMSPSFDIEKMMEWWPFYLFSFVGAIIGIMGFTLYLWKKGTKGLIDFLRESILSIFSNE